VFQRQLNEAAGFGHVDHGRCRAGQDARGIRRVRRALQPQGARG
jgi:hypothetical protein